MTLLEVRWLLYQVWRYYRAGEPLPSDVYGTLVRRGFSPEAIEEAFDEGYTPRSLADAVCRFYHRFGEEQPQVSRSCCLCGGKGCLLG